jgi:hypothetical protein
MSPSLTSAYVLFSHFCHSASLSWTEFLLSSRVTPLCHKEVLCFLGASSEHFIYYIYLFIYSFIHSFIHFAVIEIELRASCILNYTPESFSKELLMEWKEKCGILVPSVRELLIQSHALVLLRQKNPVTSKALLANAIPELRERGQAKQL